jgi:hypothetical protein
MSSSDTGNKNLKPKFISQLVSASVIIFILATYPVMMYASSKQLYSFIGGYLIGLVNALIGYRMNEAAFNKPVKVFMVMVFGGMGLRILIIGFSIFMLLYFAKLDEYSLIGSVFVFYIVFLVLEILYLHKKQQQAKISLAPQMADDKHE